MADVKEFKTYQEQIAILRKKGCIIDDEAFCESVLKGVGYYRFTAYFLPFKNEDGTYIVGTSFKKVYNLYEFDRKLHSLLFSAIEVIEVHLRSSLSYFHSEKYGPLGYLNPATFNEKHNAEKFKESIDREIENNNKVQFVKHHIDNYEGKFPLWVISELFTFGTLSCFYNDLSTSDKKVLAGKKYKNWISWLRCCTDLRNICAHYGRLYYRIFSAMPTGFSISEGKKRRLWGAMLVVRELYPSAEKWNAEFVPALEALIEAYKADIDLYHIAFPTNWSVQLRK